MGRTKSSLIRIKCAIYSLLNNLAKDAVHFFPAMTLHASACGQGTHQCNLAVELVAINAPIQVVALACTILMTTV